LLGPLRANDRMARSVAQGQVPGSTTDPIAAYDAVRTAMLLAALLEGPHGVVVEVGSGSGIATRCLPHLPGNRLAVGVDVERGALRKAAETSDRVNYLAASADSGLPFRTGSVDAVVASEVYEHLEHREDFIEELRRILKPAGRLVLTTPNTESAVLMLLRVLPREWAKTILSRSDERQQYLHPEFFDRYDGSPHSHRIEGASVRELQRIAQDHGFRQVRCTTWGLPFAPNFGGLLLPRVRLLLLWRLHELGVGLRHVMVVWERNPNRA